MNRKIGTYTVIALMILTGAIMPDLAVGFEPARVNGGIGAIWPQGSYDRYVSTGVNITGRITHDFSPVFSIWGGLGFSVFSNKESLTKAGVYFASVFPARQEIDQKSGALHLGIEFGLRKGLIRPRIAAGPGFYLFVTETRVTEIYDFSPESAPTTRYDDMQGNFGWRAIAGADIAVSPNWGISLDFMHDTVWKLHQGGEVLDRKKTSRFISVTAGVVFTFEAFLDRIKEDEWEPRDIPRDTDGK